MCTSSHIVLFNCVNFFCSILGSYFHFLIISFFDQFSTDELSFDIISTNVVFDEKSHSMKGFSTKSHGSVPYK